MSLQNTLLTTNTSNIFVSSGDTIVTTVYLCNTTGSAQNFTVYAVPSGSNSSATNCIYYNMQLSANDTYIMDTEKLILGNGDTIQASATANASISTTVSYYLGS